MSEKTHTKNGKVGSGRLQSGDVAPDFTVVDMFGEQYSLSAFRGSKVMVSFYRYVACPLCNLRMHQLAQRREDFARAGLKLIAFFQSPKDSAVRKFKKRDLPFPIIPDPDREIYEKYRIESSWAAVAVAMVHPRAVSALVRGFLPGRLEGDTAIVPADFLIDEAGNIVEAFYGSNIAEHMPMETLDRVISAG